jgi:arylsulfatase A-like enzyme
MSPTRPNVLLVTFDQWSGRLLGCAGHPVIQTPTLDHLAQAGTRFTRAYTECPICIPARRTLMTGTTTRTHGDRVFGTVTPMPELPTLAQTFRDAGYQASAVGKFHVYPPRSRIGFDDIILSEEGRPHIGGVDDHDIYLADRGFPGRNFLHGMNNNDYVHRAWHLPEDCHVTNWATLQMSRTIKRRDPTRPAFWTLSYTHPHPPLVPLQAYLDHYRPFEMDPPLEGEWAGADDSLPRALRLIRDFWPKLRPEVLAEVRRAFYALCTHIDHQLRVVIGTLREEGLLDDTVILLTADHGDMLGDFGLYAKRTYHESSANIPMILVGPRGEERIAAGRTDDRLVGLQDVMPTLLSLAGIPVPDTCDGRSMVEGERRATLYGDCLENNGASRMLHDGRYKLIWYPAGNGLQLFDLETDPTETTDLAADPAHAATRDRLSGLLAAAAYGKDVEAGWVRDGKLLGHDPGPYRYQPDRTLTGQRGLHFPEPPRLAPEQSVGFPG